MLAVLRTGGKVVARRVTMSKAGLRMLLSAVAATILAALPSWDAWAQHTVAGIWEGRYSCGQGATGLMLTVRPTEGSNVEALFRFYAVKSNPGVPEGCFEMTGTYVPGTRQMDLSAGRWLLRPFGYVTVDLSGTVSADGSGMSGTVIGPLCTRFELHRGPMVPRSAAPACRSYDVTASLDEKGASNPVVQAAGE